MWCTQGTTEKVYASLCEFLQGFAILASFCKFLRGSARFCEFLRVSASFCEFLRVSMSFYNSCEFLRGSASYFELFRVSMSLWKLLFSHNFSIRIFWEKLPTVKLSCFYISEWFCKLYYHSRVEFLISHENPSHLNFIVA